MENHELPLPQQPTFSSLLSSWLSVNDEPTQIVQQQRRRQQQQRRQLAEKYHPEKEDYRCTVYFANGTSTTVSVTAPSMDWGGDRYRFLGRDNDEWGGYGYDNEQGSKQEQQQQQRDDENENEEEDERPPPCRYYGYNPYNNDNEDNGDANGDGQQQTVDPQEQQDQQQQQQTVNPQEQQTVDPQQTANPQETVDPQEQEQEQEEEMETNTTTTNTTNTTTTTPTFAPTGDAPTGDVTVIMVTIATNNSDPEAEESSRNETAAPTAASTAVTAVQRQTPPPNYNYNNNVNNNSNSNSNNNNVSEQQQQQQQQQQPSSVYPSDSSDEDESYLANLVRVGISVALPPFLNKGIPRDVARAVTKLLNITSVLRSDDLLEEFLGRYEDTSSTATIIASLLNLAQQDDSMLQMPTMVIPPEQPLLFFLRYHDGFHHKHPSRAFFWELVHEDTHAQPLSMPAAIAMTRQIPTSSANAEDTIVVEEAPSAPPQAVVATVSNTKSTSSSSGSNSSGNNLDNEPDAAATLNNNVTASSDLVNASNTSHSVSVATPEPLEEDAVQELGIWWLHTVAFRCYYRNDIGQIHPLLDEETLELIQHQMHLWLSYHVNMTHQLFEKLHRDGAAGIAMPGQEYEVIIDPDSFSLWPPQLPGHDSHDPPSIDLSSHDCLEDKFGDDDLPCGDEIRSEGTYKQPLLTSGEGLTLETTRQFVGLIVLSLTVSCALVWAAFARFHRVQQQEHALWGTNGGTEHALQELLNVGWEIQDEEYGEEKAPRQVLVIYDKTRQGMGYRDDDSLLQGGIGSPEYRAHCY